MIRSINVNELSTVNKLLESFNYSLTPDSFNNDFLKVLIYCDEIIKGVIVYNLIYDRIEIDYIIVLEDFKRLGIGTKLLKEIEKHNVKNISLEVKQSNLSAINFYKKNGFKIVTKRDNYYGNEDGYLMIKELGE